MPRIVHEATGLKTPLGDTIVVMFDLSDESTITGLLLDGCFPGLVLAQSDENGPIITVGRFNRNNLKFPGEFRICWLNQLTERKIVNMADSLRVNRDMLRQLIFDNLTVKPPEPPEGSVHSHRNIRVNLPA